jgi:hypothetical protein
MNIFSRMMCGNEFPGMILLCDFKGAIRLDHSKYLSVLVSTCASYNLNASIRVVWKL